MVRYTFKWAHPAQEVFVTGTFDDWAKTVKLEKHGDVFEKEVELAKAEAPIYYKFFVDGNWVTDDTAAQEKDAQDNLNNVLRPADLGPSLGGSGAAATAIMSGVTPDSTTAKLASQVPLEDAKSATPAAMPGDFPETPAQEPSDFTTAPGTAADASQTVGVAPIPASAGIGNPIQLKPGEKVPDASTLTANTVQSTVTTDREAYERAGSAPGLTGERAEEGGAFAVPPISKNMIPESSLPIGSDAPSLEKATDPVISSAAPDASTAALAQQVPLEGTATAATAATAEGVPEVVRRSQAQAQVSAEAAAVPAAVREKGAVERELLDEVKADGTTTAQTDGTPAEGEPSSEAAPAKGTAGAAPKTTEAEAATEPTPAAEAPSSTAANNDETGKAATGGKEKRRSGFFGSSSAGDGSTSKDEKRKSGFFRKLTERFKK